MLFYVFIVYLMECVNGIGMDYRGTKSKTKSGKKCQRWASKYPHNPKYAHTHLQYFSYSYKVFYLHIIDYKQLVWLDFFAAEVNSQNHSHSMTPSTHPNADLESDFCRNPDGDSKGPWCYTRDPETRWETCNVQDCSGTLNILLFPHCQ